MQLGEKINRAMDAVRWNLTNARLIAYQIPLCDQTLPAKSRLTESHLDDLNSAKELIVEAGRLIEGLLPEALENA